MISDKIRALAAEKGPIIVAIDGRCAAGKTTLAEKLGRELDCNVLHMDEFFLRPEQRTAQRLNTPGGNVDYERFLSEVLLPLKAGKPFSYRPFDCQTLGLKEPVSISPGLISLVEGSYSCHPALREYYDLRIFLTVSPEEQLRRIEKRNGPERLQTFRDRWIPLEERYFEAFGVEDACDMCLAL